MAVAPVNRQYGLLIDRIIVSVDPECIIVTKNSGERILHRCSVDDRIFHASKGERKTVFLVTLIFLKEDPMRFLVLWPCIRYPNRMLPSQTDGMPRVRGGRWGGAWWSKRALLPSWVADGVRERDNGEAAEQGPWLVDDGVIQSFS